MCFAAPHEVYLTVVSLMALFDVSAFFRSSLDGSHHTIFSLIFSNVIFLIFDKINFQFSKIILFFYSNPKKFDWTFRFKDIIQLSLHSIYSKWI